jgi:hypothetical protein
MLKKSGFSTVGYAESAISMAGWGVAWCAKMLDMKAVIYDPQYKRETPKLLEIHRKEWAKYDPVTVGVPAGRTKINFYFAKKHLQENYPKSIMIPIGLRVQETVDATGAEWVRTMDNFQPDVTVVPVGSGTILAGILKYAKELDGELVGVMCYTGSQNRKAKSIFAKAGKSPGALLFPAVNMSLVDAGWEYTEYATTYCPFPCHPYYDLKAWDWLVKNMKVLKGKVLFWNIGKEVENFTVE